MNLEETDIYCPYCGEHQTVFLDPSDVEEEHYIQDCQVCCRPIQFHLSEEFDGSLSLTVSHENEG
ncbi:MAG: hypothetical protein CSH37_09915 [Thalassolituus sp.]|jgi:transposase-like protein|uniref:CPXCG motif-containing cysteine-rich protein n=1 Tax=Thalassolituus maritimus TaxID=484498 RepID=A0ABQ0A313_9GAMM|nr:CPXCG motif-containing cysteine-rich protein [Pseudomonadota bacterium]MEC8102315.1 CPXCG motif-containing cysteine-rich protein [Pseudomonadota bacterium]MEC8525515.1 CPXCG motif-containing cysteine-rich protein [Pseudomonadota bacterium]MEE2748934.1 CPXCG motif-containing cysteine-rich protein [Pseudomonadota bacterium]TNC84799.1 MAG: hypothetical protein CSH37_09915 [Thalassolituus sp.]|tara:strand:- start:3485 stop:3679 length:195 start_codon:yes stop_codon:yes gene_type:complete